MTQEVLVFKYIESENERANDVDKFTNVVYCTIDQDSNLTLYDENDKVVKYYTWEEWSAIDPVDKENKRVMSSV